jgi:hypothetical protein
MNGMHEANMRRAVLVGVVLACGCDSTTPVVPIRASLRAFVDTGFFNHLTPDSGTLKVTVGDSSLLVPPGQWEASHCLVLDVLPQTKVHYVVHFPNVHDSLWADVPAFKDRHFANVWVSVGPLEGGGKSVVMRLFYVSQSCGDTAGVAP